VPIGKQWPVNAPVSIGAGSWLGTGAVVLPGATIGRNVVVAAGSVVRGNVPDHCVVGGVPARVIRRYSGDGEWVPADEAARLDAAAQLDRAAQLNAVVRLEEVARFDGVA
jgi:serine acetyltransferase